MNDGTLVMWILVPLFGAVGLYLIWYTRSRKKMLEAFAGAHSFPVRPDNAPELEKVLDDCFSLRDQGLVRSFGQLSSIIEATPVRIFRAVELLDLNPHARAYSTNFSRIIALFEVSGSHGEFFLLDKSGQASPRLPGSKSPDPEVVTITEQLAKECDARHTLSVTLANGHGLIYFEPLVTGGESLSDIESLYKIARAMHEKLLLHTGDSYNH